MKTGKNLQLFKSSSIILITVRIEKEFCFLWVKKRVCGINIALDMTYAIGL